MADERGVVRRPQRVCHVVDYGLAVGGLVPLNSWTSWQVSRVPQSAVLLVR